MAVLDRETHQPLFPSWSQLLMAAAERLDAESKPEEASLIRSHLNVSKPDFLYAATRARAALGPLWYEFLKDKLDIEHDRIDDGSLELARCVWRLGSQLVITTNYDEVLRWACPQSNDLQSWDIQAPAEQVQLMQKGLQRPTLWHLHGRISNAAQMILALDSYQLLYPEASSESEAKYKAALETLRQQIASKSLLFVGFSLEDEFFGMQLKGVNEIFQGAPGPHYVLIREADKDRLRHLNLPVEAIAFETTGPPLIELLRELSTLPDATPVIQRHSTISPVPKTLLPDFDPSHHVFHVPFRQKGNEIVGQEQALQEVRKQLTEGKRTAIGQTASFRGLGGLGKTQLAVEYAYRHRSDYPNGVIWINADQDIDAQLIEIAHKGRWIAPASEHKYKLQIAQQRLRSYSDCLVIFDNLDDRRAIDAYLPDPEANPHILVTSRNDFADFAPVPLELLDQSLSVELLIQESRRQPANDEEESAAGEIARSLGGLPLALELAGAYLSHRQDVSFRQYRHLLSKDLKTAFPRSLSSFTQHEADLYHTLKLSEDLLKEEVSLRNVLDLLTWSGSSPMSTALISKLLDNATDADLTNALALGSTLRLLQKSEGSDNYSLHRLVGEVRRGELMLEERTDWVDTICERLGDWFQERREDFAYLPLLEAEIDHLDTWQRHAARFAPIHASRLMWLQAYPAYHRGRYAEARNYVVEARRIFRELGLTDRELEANLLNDLASTNDALGSFSSVLDYHKKALTIQQDLFGDKHAGIATSLNNIGVCYNKRGDWQNALQYSEQALQMRRELFGERHRDIANSFSNVGRCYGEQGDWQRALEYSEQAFAMQRELFGERHPDVASSLSDMGRWYGEQGELQRAVHYKEEALAMRRELFGERHPAIAISLNDVGRWAGEQGNLRRALNYSEQALAMLRELFGESHPHIATVLNNFGRWTADHGDPKHALDYLEQALSMDRELLGYEHPSTASSAASVAACLIQLSRRTEAYDLVKEFLAKLPAKHPARERLQQIERQLLSQPLRKGFRQPRKKGKGKKNKR
jgi:tetratricopeptide (TPR) repeat protein